MKAHNTIGIAMITVVLVGSFQNCSRFKMRAIEGARLGSTDGGNRPGGGGDGGDDFNSNGGVPLRPTTDKLDPACMTSAAYDACIFLKNPVAQKGSPLGSPTALTEIAAVQTYGVKLSGVAAAGPLENPSFKIRTLSGTPVQLVGGTTAKKAISDDSTRSVAQLMTFYWLNRTKEYVEASTGVFYAKDKGIEVFVDDHITGWSAKNNSIHLIVAPDGRNEAWNGDLTIHNLALANLHYATNGGISSGLETKHKICGNLYAGCCTTDRGCARAISSGVGDYMVAMMFPETPSIGETWANSIDGTSACAISRDLRLIKDRTVVDAYGACTASLSAGNVTVLGGIYASMWWNVRAAAETAKAGAAREIDTIFMQHLAVLTGADDFSTALAKIKSVDARLYAGRYSAMFDTEFRRRGL